MNTQENSSNFIFGIVLILLIGIICTNFFIFGVKYGNTKMIQKLCNVQTYDFCEIIPSEPTYKMKEGFIK